MGSILELERDANAPGQSAKQGSGEATTSGERAAMAQFIECRPEVMLGKPVFKGTRIPVELVLRKVGEGATEAEVLEAYPRLTQDHLRAAVLYAADIVRGEVVVFFEPEQAQTR